jgi:Na+/H+ antiporter NhaD/arsenite permease-like protein
VTPEVIKREGSEDVSKLPKSVMFFLMLVTTVLGMLIVRWTGVLPLDARQMASIAIFSTFIYGTLLFGDFRLAFAFGGIGALLALDLLTVEGFVKAASLNVIIFLVGMFLVIGYLEENRFFESIVSTVVAKVGPRPKALLVIIMLMGTVSAALVDEVTSILFMSGTMMHLTGKYKLNPVPFIIMLVFATNIGSAASSIGNPIGVMISLKAGFSFLEFLRWSAPIAVVVNVVTYLICRWWFAKEIFAFESAVRAEHEALKRAKARRQMQSGMRAGGSAEGGSGIAAGLAAVAGGRTPAVAGMGGGMGSGGDMVGKGAYAPSTAGEGVSMGGAGAAAAVEGSGQAMSRDDEPDIFEYVPVESPVEEEEFEQEEKKAQFGAWIVFVVTILLLVTHGLTEKWLGQLFSAPGGRLGEGTMMIGTALIMGATVLMLRGSEARGLVERRVDWWTLSFFMMLFASVGTLQETGVTRLVADRLIAATGEGHPALLIQIIGWSTGWLSAFLDNVLAVATFLPVVEDVRAHAARNGEGYPEAVYWLMLFGGTFMGNMTVIGSTANIIAVGVLEKRGHGTVNFGYWFKIGFIVSIASMLVATVLLGVQTDWFTTPMLPPPTVAPSINPR